MKKKATKPEITWISRLAEGLLGRSNDAVKLAWLEGDNLTEQIGELDLSLLSEFKRNANGTVEIRLVDRVKAMEELIGLLHQQTGSPGGQAEALYQALEDRAGERK